MSAEHAPEGLDGYEPSADARVFARSLRDWYAALRLEGFSETQCIALLGHMLAAAATQEGD